MGERRLRVGRRRPQDPSNSQRASHVKTHSADRRVRIIGPLMLASWLFTQTVVAAWTQVNDDGFGPPNIDSTTALAVYRGHLYAGTSEPGGLYRGEIAAGRLVWERMHLPMRFGRRTIFDYESVPFLIVADDHAGTPWLYVVARARGTRLDGTGESDVLVRLQSVDGTRFAESNIWGVRRDIADITAVAVLGGRLLVAIGGIGPCEHPFRRMYLEGNDRIGGPSEGWGNVLTDIGLAAANYRDADCALQALTAWGDTLYGATTRRNDDGSHTAELWRTLGTGSGTVFESTHWEKVAEYTAHDLTAVTRLTVFDDRLYIGTAVVPGGGTGPVLLRLRGRDAVLERVTIDLPASVHYSRIDVLQAFSGRLYVGLGGATESGRQAPAVLRMTAAGVWQDVTPTDLQDDPDNRHLGAAATASNRLFIGTAENAAAGSEVWQRYVPPLLPPLPAVPERAFRSLYLIDCGPCPHCLGAEKPCDPRVNRGLDEFLVWSPGRDVRRFQRSRLGLKPDDGMLTAAAPLLMPDGGELYIASVPFASRGAPRAGLLLLFDGDGNRLMGISGRHLDERLGRSLDVEGDEAAAASSTRVIRLRGGQLVSEWPIPTPLNAVRGVTVAFVDDRDGDRRPEIAVGTPFTAVRGLLEAGQIQILGSRTGKVIATYHGVAEGQHLGSRLYGRGHRSPATQTSPDHRAR